LEFYSTIDLEKISCIAKKFHLKLVYLFGSKALGIDSKISDVDIAVLVDNGKMELRKLVLELIYEFSQIFQPLKVDIAILDKAGYTFQYKVICHGKILYKENEIIKTNFETKVIKLYLDFKKYETEYFESMHELIMQE